MSTKNKRSAVWKHFEKVSKTEALCEICQQVLKSSGNTSNLRAHLFKVHKIMSYKIQNTNVDKPDLEKKKIPVNANKSTASPTKLKVPVLRNHKIKETNGDKPNLEKKKCFVKTKKSSSGFTSKLKVGRLKTHKPHNKNSERKSLEGSKSKPSTRVICSSISQSEDLDDFGSETTSIDPALIQLSSSAILPSIIASLYLHGKLTDIEYHQSITEKLIYFICKDYHPPTVVEGTGFKTLMKEVSPLYQIPCQSTIENLISEKFNSVKSAIKEKLASIPFLSVTIDMWWHTPTSSNYLEVSVHFMDENSLESLGLGVCKLKDTPSTEDLRAEIMNVLIEWGLPEEKILSVVSGNKSAVMEAVSDIFGTKRHLKCVANSVKSLIDAIMENEGLDSLIEKTREIVLFFDKSAEASDQLHTALRLKGGFDDGHSLVLDVETQWTSSLFMLEKFVSISDTISSILLENPEAPTMLTGEELETIKEVTIILSFLEKLSSELSRELYVSASEVIPLMFCFIQSLGKFDPKHSLSKNLTRILLEEFESQFNDREQTLLLSIPMVLDPRFKAVYFLDSTASSSTSNLLKELLSEVKESDILSDNVMEPNDKLNFEMYHKSIANSSLKVLNCPGDLVSELDLYLSTPIAANLKTNPIALWEDLKYVYPKLYFLAKKYLTTRAVSIPAKKLLLEAGNPVSDERKEFLPKMLFLRNLPSKYWP